MKTSDITLLHGDCLELMRDIPDGSVDLVLCDPPYGIDYQSMRRKDKAKRNPKIAGDGKPFLFAIPQLKALVRKSGGVLTFTRWDVQQAFIDSMQQNGMPVKSIIIWDKVGHGMGDLRRAFGSRYESILWSPMADFHFSGKRPTDIIRCPRVGTNQLMHPNQKPVELLEELIRMTTQPRGTVIDYCMGSGSTGVACVNTGRRFIGIELDDHYFETAQQRIQETLDKPVQEEIKECEA